MCCFNDFTELAQIKPKEARAPDLEINDAYLDDMKELGWPSTQTIKFRKKIK